MEADIKQKIENAVIEIVLDLCPDAAFVSKYGGQLVETVAGDPSTQFGGYFFYKNHMSFEFTNGAALSDADAVLEGKGKYRRHIKASCLQDLETKALREMIKQAVAHI